MYSKLLFLVCFVNICQSSESVADGGNALESTVFVAISARNKAHVLPYFLSALTQLDYPKNRMSIWITSDHNNDDTIEILQLWVSEFQNQYHFINTSFSFENQSFSDESSQFDWSDRRFDHIIKLKEEAMSVAKKVWADYIWFLDCDVILTNPTVLRDLIAHNKTVIAPMLNTLNTFSNFWCGMDERYYYRRTEEYIPIQSRTNIGVHKVILVHSAILVNLRKEKAHKLTFDNRKIFEFNSPKDDVISFALSCAAHDVSTYVSNEQEYGYMPMPLEPEDTLQKDILQVHDLITDGLAYDNFLHVLPSLKKYLPADDIDNMGFDKIYVINLERRSERRARMLSLFKHMGMSIQIINAVDGKKLNRTYLANENIIELPEYLDPYHNRKMKLGEIGCFLSHYKIWEDVVINGYKRVIVFEDDVKFKPSFRSKFKVALDDAEKMNINWDLLYLGRKILTKEDAYVPGSSYLVNISYSHWTISYAVTLDGAKKLIDEQPLFKLIPIDEYLPIMYNRHPRSDWVSHYQNRNVKAYGIHPMLVEPTHFIGQPGYVTDTEDSEIATEGQTSANHAKIHTEL